MEQRRNQIVELVNRKGSISFAQLKEAFPSVSEMTLRTDLKALDEARRVVRVHGGVKSVEQVVGTDDLLSRRAARNAEAKQIIAEKAAALLRPNTTLFLDSGSTATAVARCIPDQPMLIYTSGLSCAMELAKLEKPNVSLPGGRLNRFSLSVCGAQSIQTMEGINFDLLLLGVTSYSPETGFTCGVEDEARLKQTVLRRCDCEQKAVLLDSSKIGLKSTFHICELSDIDIVISVGTYAQLVDWYNKGDLDFSEVTTVNLDEYRGLPKEHPQSYWYFMNENLFSKVNIDPAKTNLPDGTNLDTAAECARYNGIIHKLGGIDLQLLGIGPNGHIGFNEPGEAFELETHCIDLAPTTIEANKRFFDGNEALVPKQAYTMGIKTIMQARKVLVVANGKAKAQAVKDAVTGPVTPACPGSILQLHPDCILVADEEALSLL